MEGAAKLYLDKDLNIRVLFGSGITKSFDMGTLIDRRPELIALKDRKLFEKGKLSTSYGISWNDDIDIAIEYIYDHGTIVENEENYLQYVIGYRIKKARISRGFNQTKLSKLTGIAQGDISKLENGLLNPSVTLLSRIAKALNVKLDIKFL
ncbi:MAG: helix-turn-helix domain-containing protein [Bacilli bacterium]|nr:helix-turn-helix domain-containing protein [Bacilli bacterium]